jgi:hypothetical protein
MICSGLKWFGLRTSGALLWTYSNVPSRSITCRKYLISCLIIRFLRMIIHYWSSSFIRSQALISQDRPLASLLRVSWSHTYWHTVGLLWTSDQPITENSTYTGHRNILTQQTNIHAPSGIRTRDLSNQAAADHLRPRGHWDRKNLHHRWIQFFEYSFVRCMYSASLVLYSLVHLTMMLEAQRWYVILCRNYQLLCCI